jgi:hypothetical protein
MLIIDKNLKCIDFENGKLKKLFFIHTKIKKGTT